MIVRKVGAMERVNKLMRDPAFQEYMNRIAGHEEERAYCRHTFDHALTVARIAYAYLLERHSPMAKEVIYAAALLHDIGRFVEYETGADHAAAGAELAGPLLERAAFAQEEREIIRQAIREHRKGPGDELSVLGRALALADDWGRDCRSCQAQKDCHKFDPALLKLTY